VAQEITAHAHATVNLVEPATVLHLGDSLGDRPRQLFAVTVDDLLVARARKGDLAALEKLYRSFERPVYTLARRLTRTPHDAEDVLQETFLEVVRSIRHFRGEGSLAGWIRRVAASKALMRLRREGARPPEQELSDELADSLAAGHSPAEPAAAADRVDLEAALGRLSESARAVLWLHDVEGYSHEEIGVMAGKTPSFSKSQLARAHGRLRALLAPGAGEGPCT
jgi:RNA polymerase sigma factor (sigma-70 family)